MFKTAASLCLACTVLISTTAHAADAASLEQITSRFAHTPDLTTSVALGGGTASFIAQVGAAAVESVVALASSTEFNVSTEVRGIGMPGLGANILELSVRGEGHARDFAQAGERNTARIAQEGGGHVARLMQTGSGNQVELAQSGQGHWAALVQNGDGNSASVGQQGGGATALVSQSGSFNTVSIRQ